MSFNTLNHQNTTFDDEWIDGIQIVSSEIFMSDPIKYHNAFIMESSNAIYNGAFSLGSVLPVIPGPIQTEHVNNKKRKN